jgi:hypothetical protein
MNPDRPLTGVDIDNALIQISDIEDLLKAVRDQLARIRGETREKIIESLVCDGCDAGMDLSLAEALKAGWVDVFYAEDQLQAYFIGTCPECQEKEEEEINATIRPTKPTPEPIKLTAPVEKPKPEPKTLF